MDFSLIPPQQSRRPSVASSASSFLPHNSPITRASPLGEAPGSKVRRLSSFEISHDLISVPACRRRDRYCRQYLLDQASWSTVIGVYLHRLRSHVLTYTRHRSPSSVLQPRDRLRLPHLVRSQPLAILRNLPWRLPQIPLPPRARLLFQPNPRLIPP